MMFLHLVLLLEIVKVVWFLVPPTLPSKNLKVGLMVVTLCCQEVSIIHSWVIHKNTGPILHKILVGRIIMVLLVMVEVVLVLVQPTGSRQHCTLKSYPSLVWHTRQINPQYFHLSLLNPPISIFHFSISIYRWTYVRIQDRGCCHHIQLPAAPETADRAWPLQFLDKGVI